MNKPNISTTKISPTRPRLQLIISGLTLSQPQPSSPDTTTSSDTTTTTSSSSSSSSSPSDFFQQMIQLLQTHNITRIDSAHLYTATELFLGQPQHQHHLPPHLFQIDTKTPGGWLPGSSTRAGVLQHLRHSLATLHLPKVHTFYIHAPDPAVPLSETLAGVNDAYKANMFEEFGLSNFPAREVERVYTLSAQNGYVLPSVYQGCYSPVTRKAEKELLPLLRRLGIAFNAYSPLAGGFLTKRPDQILGGEGRFDPGHQYGRMYQGMGFWKAQYLDALDRWAEVARGEGVSGAELAYRWVVWSSALHPECGDGVVLGARTLEQLSQALEGIERGPLSEGAVRAVDAIWGMVEGEAVLDNFEAAHMEMGMGMGT